MTDGVERKVVEGADQRTAEIPDFTPYYQSERATLFCGDALEVLPTLPKKSVDLIATDPPYGVTWQSNRRTERWAQLAGDDGTLDVVGLIGIALTALRPFRHIYCFGPADLSSLRLQSQVELVWDKCIQGPGDLTLPWGPEHEPIQFSVFVPSGANKKRGDGRLACRIRQGSVIRVQRQNASGVKRHPTEKPIALMRQLVESSSVLGETVLDPFSGSGATLVAALLEGRKAVGIEIDVAFCSITADRLAATEAILDKMEGL